MKMRRLLTVLLAAAAALGMSLPAAALITGAAPAQENPLPPAPSMDASSYAVALDGEQMLFGPADWRLEGDPFAAAAAKYASGGTVHLQTIPADGVNRLAVSAALCGVVIEPSDTGSFELDTVGASGPISARLTLSGGTLTLTARGSTGLRYLCTREDARVNTVLLRVPAQRYFSLTLSAHDALVHAFGDAVGSVGGSADGGLLYVTAEKLSARCTMTCTNGDVVLEADEITGKQDVQTDNGDISVRAGKVGGELYFRSENGDISVSADTLGRATVTTRNGDLLLDVKELSRDAYLKDLNGDVRVNFRKEPQDLDFVFSGGNFDEMKLPRGWEGGVTLGSGEPKFTLRAENGAVRVTFGKLETP
ncbi:DUF4097 family beta strand repeat-containing protein [uncultured Anaerotruncus sp.]|uniref:DUF4097 family beta strand repeat-containing protein n=1 Tax=uncultured Anaerotruncus sp. TaxID=905011 RepID=UPI00280A8038|nr:DUF4097 family beta strand repeat-containing protein [uncultured Anaerotruncus sp.]